MINPAIVEGQIRGGVAQGIGGVLYEHSAYGDDGQFLAGTFMDYLVPTAMEIPHIEIEHLEPAPTHEVNFRGVGEGGAIGAPAALTNAIEDALAPFGVRINEQYLPPSRILELAGIIPVETGGGRRLAARLWGLGGVFGVGGCAAACSAGSGGVRRGVSGGVRRVSR